MLTKSFLSVGENCKIGRKINYILVLMHVHKHSMCLLFHDPPAK